MSEKSTGILQKRFNGIPNENSPFNLTAGSGNYDRDFENRIGNLFGNTGPVSPLRTPRKVSKSPISKRVFWK